MPATSAVLLVPWFAPVSFGLGPCALAIILCVALCVRAQHVVALALVRLCNASFALARHGGGGGGGGPVQVLKQIFVPKCIW